MVRLVDSLRSHPHQPALCLDPQRPKPPFSQKEYTPVPPLTGVECLAAWPIRLQTHPPLSTPEKKYFRRSRRGQWRRAMVKRDRLQVRLEHKMQKWNVPWYAVRSCFARLSETSCVCQQTCMSFSLGHKNTTALTQQLLLYSAKQANRHLLFRVQVCARKGSKEHFVRSTCKICGTSENQMRAISVETLGLWTWWQIGDQTVPSTYRGSVPSCPASPYRPGHLCSEPSTLPSALWTSGHLTAEGLGEACVHVHFCTRLTGSTLRFAECGRALATLSTRLLTKKT